VTGAQGGSPGRAGGTGESSDAEGEADPARRPASPAVPVRVRRGLALGAGGVLGFAWMVGALQDAEGFDCRDVDACVGASAGSILAALLGLGVGVDAIVRHQQGIPLPADPRIDWDHDADAGGALPPRPGLGLGSPDLLLQVARNPRRLPPLAALSAVLPRGRGTLRPVGRMIEALAATGADLASDAHTAEDALDALDPIGGPASGRVVGAGASPGREPPGSRRATAGAASAGPAAGRGPEQLGGWPTRPQTWIVAMDYDSGQRVAFGRDGSPPARLSEAVMASCAIPAWYPPVRIDRRRYIDGGTSSPTSLDLLVAARLDEVWVLAPMVSFATDRPRSPAVRLERRLRRTLTRRVLAEAAGLRESGPAVTMLGPGPEDLRAMGANLMNPRRRVDVLSVSLRTSAEALRRDVEPAGRPARRSAHP